jgi:hypothetical protein
MAHPVMWFEVLGTNANKLRDFYSGLFGWTFRANDPVQYGVVDTGAARGIPGGIGEIYPGTRLEVNVTATVGAARVSRFRSIGRCSTDRRRSWRADPACRASRRRAWTVTGREPTRTWGRQ